MAGPSLRDRLQAILAGFVDEEEAGPAPRFAVHCCLPPALPPAPLSANVLGTPSVAAEADLVASENFLAAASDELIGEVVDAVVPPFFSDGVAASVACVSSAQQDSLVWGPADCLLRRTVEAALAVSTPGRPLLLSAVRADGDRLLDLVAGDRDGDGDSDGDGDGGLRDEWKLRWATLSSPGDLQTCLTEAARPPRGATRVFRLARQADGLAGPWLTLVEVPAEDPTEADCPFGSSTSWHGLAHVLQALAYRLPFVPYCAAAPGRLLAPALPRAAQHRVVVDCRGAPAPPAALALIRPLLRALLWPPPGAGTEAALQSVRSSIREGLQILSAVATDPSPSGGALQRCLDFERAALQAQHALWLRFLEGGAQDSTQPTGLGSQPSPALRWAARAQHLAALAALEADYRAMAVRLLEDSQLRGKAEQVLWRAQLEQQAKALRQLQAQTPQVRPERDPQNTTRRSSSSVEDPRLIQACLPRNDSRLPLTHSEWLDDTVARHRATLLEMPSSDVPREEVERRLETLENLYQTRQHLHATAGRFSPPTPTTRSCAELQKVIQDLHQDLVEKGLQLYRQGEALEAARRQLKDEAAQAAAWRQMALKERRQHASLHRLHDRILGLANGLFDFTALHLLFGKKVVRGSDEMLPQFLRGLEAVLVDGLQAGCSFWDFVEHTQKTMADKLCRKEFANPNAKEQVSAVLALERDGLPLTGRERGQLWLLLALNHRSLLDALRSLEALQPAYYGPAAFGSSAEGRGFVMAALRLVHLLPFRLGMTDIRWFDGGPAASPGLSHLESVDATVTNTPFTLASKSPRLAPELCMPPLDLGSGGWADTASVSSSRTGRRLSTAVDQLSSRASALGFFSRRFK